MVKVTSVCKIHVCGAKKEFSLVDVAYFDELTVTKYLEKYFNLNFPPMLLSLSMGKTNYANFTGYELKNLYKGYIM